MVCEEVENLSAIEIHRNFLLASVLFILVMGVVDCSQTEDQSAKIQKGFTREDVKSKFGNPDEVNEFELPKVPFYGPQEGLVNLLDPGTLVEEWIYLLGEEVLFVWFAGEADQPIGSWSVIETATYPEGAVY
jgi:hypothetical protein